MLKPLISLIAFFILTLSASPRAIAEDLRSYMHGIEAVRKDNGDYVIFFSSSGLPPTGADDDGSWPHDVYVATWGPHDGNVQPKLFISKPEAQEPASAARTTDGHIMVTFEDGWNSPEGLTQRFGVYDDALNAIAAYPRTVSSGGHSGHVTAVGNKFVVFYSEEWIAGGGVDNLGSGNGVYTRTYSHNGDLLDDVDVVTDKREWWPMLAGSMSRAVLIWQQFVSGETYAKLKMAILDPTSGKLTAPKELERSIKYYTYRPVFVPDLDRFLVVGTTFDDHGFAYLIDNDGMITAKKECLPAFVREGGVLVTGTTAYAPSFTSKMGNTIIDLALTKTSIAVKGYQKSALGWYPIGSVGLLRDKTHAHWISLSPTGLQEADFNFNEVLPLEAAPERCEL